MRIISFPHAPMQAFLSVPVQILAPWINRIKHSFENSTASSGAQHFLETAHISFVPGTAAAVNDDLFDIPAQMARQFGNTLCGLTSQGRVRGMLRVVRESDAAIKPDCAGRMVISGRMADVCAELDRMAQQAMASTTDA